MTNSEARKRLQERRMTTDATVPTNGPQVGELRIEPDYAEVLSLWWYADADDSRPTLILQEPHAASEGRDWWPAVVRTVEAAKEVESLRAQVAEWRAAAFEQTTRLAAALADVEALTDPTRRPTDVGRGLISVHDVATLLAKHAPDDAPAKEAER